MDRRRAAGVLLALAACVAYATAAPTASNHTSLDLYDGAPDGCYYNFQHYGEGDRIMTNEPCLNCTCHNRMLMCYLRVCPFTKPIGQDCTIEKRADQCCPIVTCPDVPVDLLTSTTTSPAEYGATGLGKLDKYGCSIHGKYFPEGSKVPPMPNKPCEHCYCIRNMTTCVMQECTLHVDGCTPIYHKDVCCPVRYSCDHPEDEMPLLDDLSTTVRPTPGFLLTTTTLSPVTQMSQDCLYENQIISDGALIKTEKACDHCYCMKGDIVCVVQECGTPMENEGKNCTALAPREGVCCPDTYICEGDEPTTGTYESLDYTTELEKLTTLSPPRRAGSEGSGYRNEPDGIPNTESPTFETETEGSGYEQATIHPTDATEALPDSHKNIPSDETPSNTGESNEFIAITTKEPISDHADITTESDVSQQKETVQSTTNTYISQKAHDSLTTIAQDEDIGSGEEDITTPYDLIPTPPATPALEVSEPTEVTTKSYTENNFDKKTTISSSMIDEDKTNIPNEQNAYTDDSAIDITTETRRRFDDDQDIKASTIFDEEYHATEYGSLQTTNIPIINEDERESTIISGHDEESIDAQHYTTSASSFDDEIATTESQDVATGSFEGTGVDVDLSHQITITASTPLLEEIEKDTADQENVSDQSTLDGIKTSTTLSNIPTEEAVYKDSSKPDLGDEIDVSNIPTTVSPFENNAVPTAGSQKTHETEDSSESQQYVPTTIVPVAFDDEIKKTVPLDSVSTEPEPEGQKTDMEESSEPQQYAPTTSAIAIENETRKSTPSDSITTLAPQVDDIKESLEPLATHAPAFEDKIDTSTLSEAITPLKVQDGTDLEQSSEPQQYAPTTIAPLFDDKTKETTSLDYINTSKPQKSQETDFEESSEPQQYSPTTTVSAIETETKKATPYDLITTVKIQDGQESDYEYSSEPQQYAPTTGVPALEEETKKIASSDYMTTSAIPERHETDVEESSEPQQYAPTTSGPVFESETKITTLSDSLTTPKTQEKTDLGEGLKTPTTSVPVIEDKTEKTTPSDSVTTSMAHEDQEIEAEASSEPQLNDATTSASTYEDEFKKTTSSKMQASHETDVEASSEPQQYGPTTTVSAIEDEIKETTLSQYITTSKMQEEQETDVETSSEPQQYAPTTSGPIFDHEAKETTPSDSTTTSKLENDQEIDVKASSEPQQYDLTTSSLIFEDDIKETTPLDSMATSKTQETQQIDSEPQQYATTTTIEPIFEDETKTTKSPLSMITSQTQEDQKPAIEESSEPQQYGPTTSVSTFADEITTAEPDKGLNTIPSGLVDEETTEYVEKHTYTKPTESAVEFENKLIDKTESDTLIHPTLTPDTSTSTESEEEVNDDKIVPIETLDIGIAEQTTVFAEDVSEEAVSTVAHDHHSSTEIPISDHQEINTSTSSSETVDQAADSKEPDSSTHASSSQAAELEHTTSEGNEAVTSSPSYETTSSSTSADLQENEIINESRIPGEGDCLLNGVTYRNESAVPNTNKCQSGCRCSSSIIKCDPIICSSPPEYMDNCQTTYDSLDSCCPTYVCDHKTETMPPQSHSQMSGTDAPEVTPVKCNGDECILSGDKNLAVETSGSCKSGTCISEDKISSHPSNIPEQPTVDRHEECIGNKCASPDSTDQLLCNDENGCQASPVKPCQGTDCEVTSDSILPQKQQPCADGQNCDIPIKDCSTGLCESNGENILDIEKECTEKSCKRKEDSDLETPAVQCLGSECQSTNLDVTEKIEKPAVSLLPTEIDSTTKAIEAFTNEPDQYVPVQTSIDSQPLPTTILPDITTKQPEQDSDKDKISTIYESATLHENQNTTPYFDDEIETKTPTSIADISHVTEKLEDDIMTTEAGDIVRTDSPDLSLDKYATTETVKETQTSPPKTHSTEIQEITELPLETDNQEKTTYKESVTDATTIPAPQLPEKESAEDEPTTILDEMFTKPPKAQSETDDNALSTMSLVDSDVNPQEVTKSPQDKNEDTTAKTSAMYDMDEFTKSPQVIDDKEATGNVNEENYSTTPKTYESDSHKTTVSSQTNISDDMITQITDILSTKSPEPHITDIEEDTKTTKESQNEGTTTKPISELAAVPELPIVDRETTKLPDQYIEEHTTELSKIHDSDKTKVTKSPETAQDVITTTSLTDDIYTDEEATKKSTVTEPSIIVETEKIATKPSGEIEFTTIKIVDETHTEPSKYNEISHETMTTQQDSETEDSLVSKFSDEIGTETPIYTDSEPFDTTKSPDEFDRKTTSVKVTKETEIDPSKSDDLKPQPVTESDSMPLDTTTIKSSEDEIKLSSESHLLEKTTTLQPETASESTTQTDLDTDSKISKPEKIDVNEITFGTTPSIVDSSTENIDKATFTSSVSLIPVSDHDILTESALDLVTKPEPHDEVTVPSDIFSGDGKTPASESDINITDKTVTKLPQQQGTINPDENRETTKASMDLDEMTPKPTIALDDKIQEDINTKTPVLLETERDTVYEVTTLKPIHATETLYDIKTEQPPSDEKQDETLNEITEKISIAEEVTTALPMSLETKLPVETSEKSESFTDEPFIHDQKPSSMESSETETPEKDKSETETPFSDELTTVTSQYEDDLTESSNKTVKEPEITQHHDINTMPTEFEEETYTKRPLHVSSEAAEQETVYTSDKTVDEDLTTPVVKVSEPTTEPADILTHIPTESSGIDIVDTEIPTETTEKEFSETQGSQESSSSEDKETESVVTEISTVPESITKEQISTDILSTDSSKDTEASEMPEITQTEKTFVPVTEPIDKIKDTESKTPEQEFYESTEPAEQTTMAQNQKDNEIVDLATVTKDFDSTPTSPTIIQSTKAPETAETDTQLLEITTSKPDEDFEKSTSTHPFLETTTSSQVKDDNLSPVDEENTETPFTVSVQQTDEIVTSPQPVVIDKVMKEQETTTELIEEEFIPSKTGKPEMYPTTLSAAEEFAKSTPSPVQEASTVSDQSLLTSIGSQETEGVQATTIVSDLDRTEIQVQTEKVLTTIETTTLLQVEPSSETPQEEKITTLKAEELSTASPLFDKFTKPYKHTEATEAPKPIPTEKQPIDDLPDEEPSIPPSGTSGYGSDPDYMEEDQTFGPGTCRYGGKVYVSAQQIPRDDPCDFCFCFRSDIICLQQSCPPPIHGCHEEPISGFCCPRYECPVSMATTVNVTTTTTTTTTTLPPHFPVHSYKGSAQKRGCLIKGHTYKVGEVVRASSGPCLHCTCGGDGQMKCDPKQCTPEPMLRQMIAAAVSAKRRR